MWRCSQRLVFGTASATRLPPHLKVTQRHHFDVINGTSMYVSAQHCHSIYLKAPSYYLTIVFNQAGGD
jgi:hypothetical protein